MDGKQVKVTEWRESNLGLVRTMTFTISNKMPIGPSEIQCHQNQRLSVYDHDHFVVETEQVCIATVLASQNYV